MWFKALLFAGSLAICASAAAAPNADAGPRRQFFQANSLVPIRGDSSQRGMSIRDIEAILSARFHGGHIVRAEPSPDGQTYRITWAMPNGNDYRELTVDAVTGQIR